MAVRVVIAEDEAIIRLDLKETLQEQGYEVVGEAADGETAVQRVRDLQPDVVLMDLIMPGMNGIEAIRRLKPTPDRQKGLRGTNQNIYDTSRRSRLYSGSVTGTMGSWNLSGAYDRNEFFYGTTSQGGPWNAGVVYKVDATGEFSVVHPFAVDEGSGGAHVRDADGQAVAGGPVDAVNTPRHRAVH